MDLKSFSHGYTTDLWSGVCLNLWFSHMDNYVTT